MNNNNQNAAATATRTQSGPVVAAVDGSERNRTAVGWAALDAASSGAPLVLVTAVEPPWAVVPAQAARSQLEHAEDMLADVRRDVAHIVAEHDVRIDVQERSPVDAVLAHQGEARMIVVGKRGLGGFARVIVGSNSIAIAGRSRVPVAIIPDSWKPEDHRDAPVVLGIDPYQPYEQPILLAFSRAQRLGVPLVAVHGWEAPSVYSWDASGAVAATLQRFEQDAHAEFDKVLDGWRERFPDVTVRAVHDHAHPAMAVLDAAEAAQLVVLGRHTDGKLGGFAFGSVTRAVLHYATCPVIVVPSEPR